MKMRHILIISTMGLATLTGCTALDSIKEYNKQIQQDALDTIYPTKAEYEAILKRAEAESIPDPNHTATSWLLVDENEDNGKKIYVNTRLVLNNKNTASADVKTLNPDQSYKIDYYKFFCYQGFGRKVFGYSYTADHRKKLQIPGFGPGEDYDRRPYKSEEPIAKTICALGGFYRGSSNDNV